MTAALAALFGLWLGVWIARAPQVVVVEQQPTDWHRHVQSALWVARR